MMLINNKLKIFTVIAVIFSAIYFILILQNRVPFAHDAFQYLQLQYVYFNEVVQNHSLPLWFPYIAQGSIGNYYFTPQISILSSSFYLIGLFIKKINYLYLFYLSIWFDEFFFLLGVVLLSSLYYKKKRTIFFVSTTLLGTVIWFPQIYWNFHIYYFVPLLLYCIHSCFDTKIHRYFIFAVLFFTLSVFGTFMYWIIFISFVIFVYILFLLPIKFKEIKSLIIKKMRFRDVLFSLILISLIILSFLFIKYGADKIIYLQNTRTVSGKVNVDTFLTYGGSLGMEKYQEIFDREARSLDINLYAGFLFVPFIILGLLYAREKISFVVGGVALILFLFSIGTPVSLFFYYLWPFGNVFRHIGLTATLFKLFAVFYAGFGFEEFLKRSRTDKKTVFFMLLYQIIVLLWFIHEPPAITEDNFYYISGIGSKVFTGIIYLVLSGNIILFLLMLRNVIKAKYLINVLLLLVVVDLFSYKYSLIITRMPRVSQSVIGLFKPYAYNFTQKRLENFGVALENNQRAQIFYSLMPSLPPGTIYSTIESFLFTDLAASSFRADYCLAPMLIYFYAVRNFPNRNGAYLKCSGIDYSKLSVFSKLNIAENLAGLYKVFNLDNFSGDMLFTTKQNIVSKTDRIPKELISYQKDGSFTNLNQRISADIEIKKFTFNLLHLKINISHPSQKYYFLYYADIYDPNWDAYVNGKKVSVIESNIGYKSIMIPGGVSDVMFKFGSMFYVFSLTATLILNSWLLITIGYIFSKEFINKKELI